MDAHFPTTTALSLAPNTPTLIVFVHPRCPCTRATMHELAGILTTAGNKLHAMVVFTLPKGVAPGWEQGDLLRFAEKMPNTKVVMDKNGVEAGRFGVKGSGHVLLYAASGRLLFSGGITPSRGHEGGNVGEDAVIAFVSSGKSAVNRTPVFGCSLL